MKKLMAITLALLMACTAAAFADEGTDVLAELEGRTLSFSSGAGAWETILTVHENGAFDGEFHDSEMGETGEGYPDGTVYSAFFEGRFGTPEAIGDGIYRLPIADFRVIPSEESIEDGIRYAVSDPYGIRNTQELILYLPGTPLSAVAEGFLPWSHLQEMEWDEDVLPYYALWNAGEESAFVSEPVTGSQDDFVGMVNPWRELTAEDLKEAGFVFGVPEGAENVSYALLVNHGLAEMRFELGGSRLTARMQQTASFTDISGMYYTWTAADSWNFSRCIAVIWETESESAPIRLCLWYDAEAGCMYSLSAQGALPEGKDLASLAAVVYVPQDPALAE